MIECDRNPQGPEIQALVKACVSDGIETVAFYLYSARVNQMYRSHLSDGVKAMLTDEIVDNIKPIAVPTL